jgi:hypothetical protein
VVLLAGIGGLLSNFLECISDLVSLRETIFHLATEAAQKAREKQKEGCDIRIRGAVIKPGDRVLVKVVSFDGKHKLADRWEQDPYIVVSPHPSFCFSLAFWAASVAR